MVIQHQGVQGFTSPPTPGSVSGYRLKLLGGLRPVLLDEAAVADNSIARYEFPEPGAMIGNDGQHDPAELHAPYLCLSHSSVGSGDPRGLRPHQPRS